MTEKGERNLDQIIWNHTYLRQIVRIQLLRSKVDWVFKSGFVHVLQKEGKTRRKCLLVLRICSKCLPVRSHTIYNLSHFLSFLVSPI